MIVNDGLCTLQKKNQDDVIGIEFLMKKIGQVISLTQPDKREYIIADEEKGDNRLYASASVSELRVARIIHI